jgi:uncharacterized protein YecE (DUF72 family)
MPAVYIGTSGWAYKEWGKKFFPKDLPQTQHLTYLAGYFNTVELNASFYRLQPSSNYRRWKKVTPNDFQFSIKVSRFITHIKRMKAVRLPWKRFFKTTTPLKEKCGPFLLQFPSSFTGKEEEVDRLDKFFSAAKKDGKIRFAVEFRHSHCFEPEMIEVIRRYKAALVFANSTKYPTAPLEATSDFIYIRLHGPRQMFASGYSEDDLKPWAKLMKKFFKEGKDVYVYFNNDQHTHAPANAKILQKLMGLKPKGKKETT